MKAFALAVWRGLLGPAVVVVAVATVLAALIEGQPLEQFLYAIF